MYLVFHLITVISKFPTMNYLTKNTTLQLSAGICPTW